MRLTYTAMAATVVLAIITALTARYTERPITVPFACMWAGLFITWGCAEHEMRLRGLL